MGARPVALLDLLRFGAPDGTFRPRRRRHRRLRQLGRRANVGGETVFDQAYADNCLVNAMCVGLLAGAAAVREGAGPGNVVVLYGATTGRDGIGGASVLASQELGEDDADKRPSVQVGDPFTGNKLIEVSLELVERGSSSRCRTAAPPGSRPRWPRWRATAPASTSTSTACRCARPTSSRGRS